MSLYQSLVFEFNKCMLSNIQYLDRNYYCRLNNSTNLDRRRKGLRTANSIRKRPSATTPVFAHTDFQISRSCAHIGFQMQVGVFPHTNFAACTLVNSHLSKKYCFCGDKKNRTNSVYASTVFSNNFRIKNSCI